MYECAQTSRSRRGILAAHFSEEALHEQHAETCPGRGRDGRGRAGEPPMSPSTNAKASKAAPSPRRSRSEPSIATASTTAPRRWWSQGSDRWEVCDDARFSGRCVVLRPGWYPTLAALGLNDRVSSARIVSRNARVDDDRYAPAPRGPPDHLLRARGLRRPDLLGRPAGRQLRAPGLQRPRLVGRRCPALPWEVCDDAQFQGQCVVLRPGRYPSLAAMSLNDRVSSARIVSAHRAHRATAAMRPPPP